MCWFVFVGSSFDAWTMTSYRIGPMIGKEAVIVATVVPGIVRVLNARTLNAALVSALLMNSNIRLLQN